MAKTLIIPKETVHAFAVESVEGTAPSDAASDAMIPELGASITGFTRAWQDDNSMLGHIGHLKPHDGGPEEPGQVVTFKVHGKGSAGSPEIGPYMKCAFGSESVGVIGDADSTPLTTTSFAFATGSAAVGHLCDVDLTGGTETRRILTYSTGTVTVWPPLSAAPAENDVLYPGVAYLLTSGSSMSSGSGFWYFANGQKCVVSGLRGNVVFTAAIRQPLMAEFTMQGIKAPVLTPAAIGYTPAPVGWGISYPIVRGIFLKSYIPVLVGGSATTTSIPITKADGTAGDFTFYGTDDNQVDKLIVDVGSSVYETQPIKSFTYATQTITLDVGDALSGAPAEDATAYIEHQTCLPDTLTFDAGHVFTRLDCAQEDDSYVGQVLTDRMATVSWSEYFADFMEANIAKNAAFTELWCIVGSTRYNKIAICAPNVFRQSYELDLGGEIGRVNIEAGAFSNSIAGNDELYVTFL